MKSRSSLFILGGVFFSLMLFTAFQISRPRTVAPPEAVFAEEQLAQLQGGANQIYTDWDEQDIQAVQLYSPLMEQALTFSRNGDIWEIVDQQRIPDQQIMDSLAQTISILPYEYEIQGVQPAQYPEFGLTQDNSLLFIRIIREDESLNMVAVGDMTATEDGFYALVDERQEVYVVNRDAISYLIYYLRDFQQPQ